MESAVGGECGGDEKRVTCLKRTGRGLETLPALTGIAGLENVN
jgi:hypothetical protein